MLQRIDRSNAAGSAAAAVDLVASGEFPLVMEYLVTARWDDGKPREVATLMLVAEGGRWKVQLRDRANRRVAWLSGDTILGVLASLESALGADQVDWRVDKWASGGQRK